MIMFLTLFILLFFIWIIQMRLYCAYKKNKRNSVDNDSTDRHKENNKKSFFNIIKVLVMNYFNGLIVISSIAIGKIPFHFIRIFFLKHVFLMDLGKKVVIHYGFQLRAPWNIRVGNGSIIGDNAILDGRNGLIIGENVNFSTGVWIWTEEHDLNDPLFRCNNKGGGVSIENRCWISCGAIILPGCTIKEGAVIAAGAVVTKNCEPFSVYGGVPAKGIGQRNKELLYDFNGKHGMFF